MVVPTPVRPRPAAGVIRYAVTDTAVGVVLLAATERGVCGLSLGDSAAELADWLRDEFPDAELSASRSSAPDRWVAEVAAAIRDASPMPDVPLDTAGSPFRHRVWDRLRTIPFGETRTYADLAAAIGSPTAVRAVARACATNPVSLLVPCHRVVGSDGSLRGYRWGLDRKRRLLDRERETADQFRRLDV